MKANTHERRLTLVRGEEVLFRNQPRLGVFTGTLVLSLFSLVAFSLAALDTAIICALLTIGSAVFASSCYFASEFILTSRRILAQTGIFSRRFTEIFLTEIDGITIDQNPLGRVFEYGTVTIGTRGQAPEIFTRISDPFAFQHLVHDQILALHEPLMAKAQ